MNSDSAVLPAHGVTWRRNSHWLLLAAGYLAMYLPTYRDLFTGLWTGSDYAHGPIILIVIAWMFWRGRACLVTTPQPRIGSGTALFACGLFLFALGRSQDILIFELGAQIPLFAGVLLAIQGTPALRSMWFPLLYIVFMIPLPGALVDAITGPLKQHVSVLAEQILYLFGYPIARSGVVISIGQYQLLVADACSGLHSMFSLSALGLLFMYIVERKSKLHNGLMLASILPIAFAANIVRVIVLALITYHFGDEAGQGFLHETAGVVLLVAALLLLFLLDTALAKLLPGRKAS